MTCLESFVRPAEVNQWPLDVITRIHIHVRDRNTHRHEDTKKDRQTNKSIGVCLTLSRSFRSMLNQVPHALEVLKPSILWIQKGAKVRLPCSKDDNFIAGVFFDISAVQGDYLFEIPNRVLTVFSQYKIAFLNMVALIHACKACISPACNATCLAP